MIVAAKDKAFIDLILKAYKAEAREATAEGVDGTELKRYNQRKSRALG